MLSDTALIVGIDVHQHINVTLVMDGCGDVVDNHQSFANNGSGTLPPKQQTISGCLSSSCQLEQLPELSERPVTLYPFNPRLVHNFKKAFGEEEITDLRDAGVIAERLRFGKKLPPPFVLEEIYLPLRTLTRKFSSKNINIISV